MPLPGDSSGGVVVYHGTRAVFDEFRASSRGTFGPGIYFGSTIQQGVIFSGEDDGSLVLMVRLTMRRPYFHKITGEPEEIDSWGEGLVKAIFPPQVASRLIQQALNGDGEFGPEIFEQLEAMGHDGVIAKFDDGSQELMALYPSQCEILERMTLDEVYARHPELNGSPCTPREVGAG